MQKTLFSRILCLSVLFIFTSAQSALQPRKPWTFLVYLAGANDLDDFIQTNMDQMMSMGSNERINVLVYLSTHYAGHNKETKKLYVNKGSVTQYGPATARDSGSVETFKSALAWACTEFPSDHIAVVCWDHGSGPLNRAPIPSYNRGVCYDYDTGHYLTDRDLLSAFSWARDTHRRGKKFDIIAFDACLMASVEIAATLASCANYMVASENLIPGAGYDYTRVLNQFNARTLDPLTFAKRMVAAYQEAYARESDHTLSAIDLQVLGGFMSNFSEVAEFLTTQLRGNNKIAAKSMIRKSIGDLVCPSFNEVYIDLLQFYKNLLKNIFDLKLPLSALSDFQALLSKGIAQFPYFIRANTVGSDFSKAGGLTVYFDSRGVDASYNRLFWTTEINGWWLHVLEAYVAK